MSREECRNRAPKFVRDVDVGVEFPRVREILGKFTFEEKDALGISVDSLRSQNFDCVEAYCSWSQKMEHWQKVSNQFLK